MRIAAQRSFFSATIASAGSCPKALSCVVQGLLHQAPLQEHLVVACCDLFAKYFGDNTSHIHHDLNAMVAKSHDIGISWAVFAGFFSAGTV